MTQTCGSNTSDLICLRSSVGVRNRFEHKIHAYGESVSLAEPTGELAADEFVVVAGDDSIELQIPNVCLKRANDESWFSSICCNSASQSNVDDIGGD